jgi:hypothetical protein
VSSSGTIYSLVLIVDGRVSNEVEFAVE